jgi:HEPN domain-containing protein
MKGKADLVQGWIRKAASDLVAMRASAKAGALDAACFHAQQAAEKYLKAFLVDRDREVVHTHNLYKLLARCSEIDPAFSELIDAAGLLTPFAVEARYDTEFWPTAETIEKAELAANRVASLVSSAVQLARVTLPTIAQKWAEARSRFDWKVDLRKFKDAPKCPGFFDRVIEPEQVAELEDAFRADLVPSGRVERAAEVAYRKNGQNYRARDRITRDLFEWIDGRRAWVAFVDAIENLALTQTWESFQGLIRSCGQTSGFATPLTFLAFYDPQRFAMVDKRIGAWWARRFPNEPQFTWNPSKTVVNPTRKSFEAYLSWTRFCSKQAAELSKLAGKRWRARDVEMAVWTDKQAELPLTVPLT